MSAPSPSTGPHQRGATSVGAEPKRNRRGLLALLGVIVLAVLLLLLLLSRCGGDDPQSDGDAAGAPSSSSSSRTSAGSSSPAASSPAASSPAASSPAASSPAGSTAGGTGGKTAGQPSTVLAADGTAVLDPAAPADPTAALGRVSGQTVTGTAVQVLSVPADEGFWVGSSDTQRVWVQLTGGAGESPYQVRQGDLVDFTGTVVAHDAGFPASVGVDEAEGASQLAAQGQYIEVQRDALRLSA